jgi:hypothetical protein
MSRRLINPVYEVDIYQTESQTKTRYVQFVNQGPPTVSDQLRMYVFEQFPDATTYSFRALDKKEGNKLIMGEKISNLTQRVIGSIAIMQNMEQRFDLIVVSNNKEIAEFASQKLGHDPKLYLD